ncbi:VOC family protein [Hyphomonas sp.]|jgi:catechol 2,3-dioxygenase-like lactoylglutathione lyase family enzyme|uniref:VOC family protein n=1 Tax=Hyphomonas sp. TaxID=87 RepID=UPI0025BDDA86|nr:VOC family protein [Hyphomonas sp.]
MIKGIHHTGLSVLSLDQAIDYWTGCFGFEVAARFDVEDRAETRALMQTDNPASRAAFLTGPTGHLELFEFEANRGAQAEDRSVHEAGIRHICLQAIDANELFDRCAANGTRWHARPAGLGTGALYAYVRDCEGNIVELEGVPWGPQEQAAPWYAHTAFVTPDIDRLTAFYEFLTDTPVHDRGAFGPHRSFDRVAGLEGIVFKGAWIRLANATLEFWQYETPLTTASPRKNVAQPGWNHICFEVSNAHETYARLAEASIRLHAPPVSNAFGILFYGRDPDGNIFECLEVSQRHRALSVDQLQGREFIVRLEKAIAAHYRSAR